MNVTIYPGGPPSGINFEVASTVRNLSGETISYGDTSDPFVAEGTIAVGASVTLYGTFFFRATATTLLSHVSVLTGSTDDRVEQLALRVTAEEASTAVAAIVIDEKINVRSAPYNCLGDGGDDATGLQAAVTAARNAVGGKGKILLPPTATNVYASTVGLDFTGGTAKHVTVEGTGGYGGGTQLAITANARGLDLRVAGGTPGVVGAFRNLWLVQSHASTAATFLDFSGVAATPPIGWVFENCRIEAANTTGVLIDLQNTVGFVFDHCQFVGADTQVRGLQTSAAGVNFSNVHTFTNQCQFRGYGTISILRPHTAWVFKDCFWEGAAGGATAAISSGLDATMGQRGLYLYGCGFTDSTAGGSWIDLLMDSTASQQCQVLIDGTGFSTAATGGKCVRLSGTNFRCLTFSNNSIYHPFALTGVSIETTNPLTQFVYFGNDIGGGAGVLTEIAGSWGQPGSMVVRAADDWTNVTFSGTWANFGGGVSTAQYVKDALGFVHLKGFIKDGAVPSAAFTLPAGYRPALTSEFGTTTASAHATIEVGADGVTTVVSGSAAGTSLESIIFRAA